jgi:hypothetical protein
VANADHTPGDRLNDHIDDLVAGDPSSTHDLDSDTAEAVRRFFASDDAPPPPRDLTTQIWEKIMNVSAQAGAIPLRPVAGAPPVPNGRAPQHAWWREVVPATVSHRRGRWAFAQLATAALLLVTLGLGYLAFGPLRSGPDRPTAIPGVAVPATPVATPPATPAATAIAQAAARASHPVTGAWRWQDGPAGTVGVFAPDGTYVEYSPTLGVGLGDWRPTGERSAELVVVYQVPADSPAGDAVFAPGYVPAEHAFKPGEIVERLTVAVDATGTTLTATGTSENRNPDGTVRSAAAATSRAALRQGDTLPADTVIIVRVVAAADGASPIPDACAAFSGPISTVACDDGPEDADPTPGSIEVNGLPTGEYQVTIQGPSGFTDADAVTVTVEPGTASTATVRLTPTGGLPTATAGPPTPTRAVPPPTPPATATSQA